MAGNKQSPGHADYKSQSTDFILQSDSVCPLDNNSLRHPPWILLP